MTTDATQNLNNEILLNLPEHWRHRSVTTSTITDEEQRANAEFLAGAYAANTSISYRSQLKAWVSWCGRRGLQPQEANGDSLVTYIRERAQGVTIGECFYKPAKPNSLNVACAAISKACQIAGLPDITKETKVREALKSHKGRTARAGLSVGTDRCIPGAQGGAETY